MMLTLSKQAALPRRASFRAFASASSSSRRRRRRRRRRDTLDRITHVVQRDEGGRGIAPLVQAASAAHALPGPLGCIATDLLASKHVTLVTGFPLFTELTPPTETDGPPGIAAVAMALKLLGIDATVVTDACNGEVVQACLNGRLDASIVKGEGGDGEGGVSAGSGEGEGVGGGHSDDVDDSRPYFGAGGEGGDGTVTMQAFPGLDDWSERDDVLLAELYNRCDHILALERAGLAADGVGYTMRGIALSPKHLSPLERLFDHSLLKGHDLAVHDRTVESGAAFRRRRRETETAAADARVRTSGVGDGGNEIGMGKITEAVHSNITNGTKIGCVTPTDNLLVCSVSNWGGYAIAAALEASIDASRRSAIGRSLLPSPEEAATVIEACVAAGARDGVTGEMEATVDGMSLEANVNIVRELGTALREVKE